MGNSKAKVEKGCPINLNVILLIILLGVFSLYVYLTSQTLAIAVNEQYTARALSIVSAINATIYDNEGFGKKSSFQRVLDNLVKIDPQIKKVSLYMALDDGRVVRVASSNHKEINKEGSNYDELATLNRRIVWEEEYKGNEHFVEVLAPVRIKGGAKASLGIYMDLTPRDTQIRHHQLRILVYSVLVVAAVIILLISRAKKSFPRHVNPK